MKIECQNTQLNGPLIGRSVEFQLEKTGERRELFAYLPREFVSELSRRDDVFVPALVMTALVNGEDLDLGGLNTDPMLVRNCISATRQYKEWVPRFRVPVLTNWAADPAPRQKGTRLATFFSGGIDSLFTLLRHSSAFPDEPTRLSDENISLALHVFHSGQKSSLKHNDFAVGILSEAAASLDARLLPVFSNIMSFDHEWCKHYTRVTHSAGLASIARMLSGNLSACFIASSSNYGDLLAAWGSSPIVDPLYSGRDMAFVDDGSTFTRFEKTEFVARWRDALKFINVCDQLVEKRGYVNCSRCQKCLRTMVALDLCNVAGSQSPSFDWSAYTPQSFGQIYYKSWAERCFAVELVEAAEAKGRHDVARAIRSGINRSLILMPLSAVEDRVRHTEFAQKKKGILLKLRTVAYQALGLRR